MKIEVRKNTFTAVKITEGNTTIDLGMLSDKERDELAYDLINALYALGPNETAPWMKKLIKDCEIDLWEKEETK